LTAAFVTVADTLTLASGSGGGGPRIHDAAAAGAPPARTSATSPDGAAYVQMARLVSFFVSSAPPHGPALSERSVYAVAPGGAGASGASNAHDASAAGGASTMPAAPVAALKMAR
jgi:hypothetical protein